MKPRAILFDLDGTILDNSSYVVEAYYQGAHLLGYTVSKELIAAQAGKSTIKTAQAMGLPKNIWLAIDTYFWDYFGELVKDVSKPLQIMPGVKEFLKIVDNQNIKMAIVTSNRSDYAKIMLDRLNISQYFEMIIGKETIDDVKPSPKPLEYALEKMEIDIKHYSDAWFVGDSISDIIAAHNAGIRAVGIHHNTSQLMQSSPHMLLKSFSQLSNYFQLSLKQNRGYTIIIDFDGTITTKDVAEEILRKFARGDWKTVEERAVRGEISMDECIIQQYEMLEGNIQEWITYGRNIPIRSGFSSFLHSMHREGFEVICVSAGLSFIIDDFITQQKWILSVIVPVTNQVNNRISVDPVKHDNTYLDFKEHQVRSRQTLGQQIIYIGDGSSDFEGAKNANIRYCVKNSALAAFLDQFNLTYTEFDTFDELEHMILQNYVK